MDDHHHFVGHSVFAVGLPVMPLDHWEADIAVALAQYILAYASRLRSNGVLATAPPQEISAEGAL